MKFQPPIDNFSWSKNAAHLFGVDHNTYFKQFNIPGHNGLDIVGLGPNNGYGTPVRAAHDAVVSSIFLDTPDHTKGNGIYLLAPDGTYTNYWHLSKISCSVGQQVKVGEVIGEMGNSGFVFPKPDIDHPYLGTHLHFGVYLPSKTNNDYKGFVDPTPFLFNSGDKLPIDLVRNLFFGSSGDDVSWLQTLLELENIFNTEPIGQFGPKTLQSVIILQKKYRISPAFGFCGPKTKSFLNQKYSVFH